MEENKTPFIAWTCAQEYNAYAPALRENCEQNLRDVHEKISAISGPADLEGVIIYDSLAQGMAVASLLGKQGHSLPFSGKGDLCDVHFDADDLCSEHNAMGVAARIHAGSKGMLVTLSGDKGRRLMLLDQREVVHLSTLDERRNVCGAAGVTGLYAHELGHARDYAAGRPGLPVLDEEARSKTEHASGVHTVLDMALAEYVATREECKVQVALYGGCCPDLTRRISPMARRTLCVPALSSVAEPESIEGQQHKADLSGVGYVIGTLAGYMDAQASVLAVEGHPGKQDTQKQISNVIPEDTSFGRLLSQVRPLFRQAYEDPTPEARSVLLSKFSESLSAMKAPEKCMTQKRKKDGLDDIWDAR